MAQPKLDIVSIAVSKEIGDEVTASNANGNLFTAAERLSAINRARGNIYTQMLNQLGITKMIDLYPEFLGKSSLSISNSLLTKTAAIRKAIKLLYTNFLQDKLIIEAVPAEQTLDAEFNIYSKWRGTENKLVFTETENTLKILGATISSGTADVLYLKQPEDIAGYGGANADLIEPYFWLDLITAEAVINLLRKKQY